MARKAGQIRQRGDRKFLVRVYLGTKANGKRHYMNRTVHGTQKAAQKVLNKMLSDRDLGILKEPERVTLDEHLDKWLEVSAAPRLKDTTLQSYTWLLDAYVRPQLGEAMLHRLSPADIQSLIAKLQARDLSPRTIRYAHTVLRNALGQAVKWELIPRNPAEHVDLPKKAHREMRAMTHEEAQRFLAAARADEQGTPHPHALDRPAAL